jgi:hypothetical protein
VITLCSFATQAFFCVLDQPFADRNATPLDLGGEPLREFGRDDNGATDAVVALPYLVGRLRQAPSSRTHPCGVKKFDSGRETPYW